MFITSLEYIVFKLEIFDLWYFSLVVFVHRNNKIVKFVYKNYSNDVIYHLNDTYDYSNHVFLKLLGYIIIYVYTITYRNPLYL